MSGLDDFKDAAGKSSGATEFHYLAHGETYDFTPRLSRNVRGHGFSPLEHRP
jgi:hypothetical protein